MPIHLPSPAIGHALSEQWKRHKPSKPEFDVAIIGGGSAGYAAARTAAALGAKTVLIEGGKTLGGLCILHGCMPSKTFLESAHRWHDIGRARKFGLVAKPIKVDMKFIQARKKCLVDEFAEHRSQQLKHGKFKFIRGFASFLDSQTLLIKRGKKQELLTASTIIVATGSVITHVPVPGLWETGCLNSDTALDTDKIPKRLAVLGGGVIAVELGQFFARVGSKTTILQRSKRLVRNYDPDVSLELERAMKAEGIDVRTGVKLLEVKKVGKAKKIIFQRGTKREEIVVDEILYALGREPAIKGLDLEAAGLALEEGKLRVDDTMATSIPNIFAAGDTVGPHEVVHIGLLQGEIAARNAVDLLRGKHEIPEKIDYRLKTLVTFTDPEIASVGLSERKPRSRASILLRRSILSTITERQLLEATNSVS